MATAEVKRCWDSALKDVRKQVYIATKGGLLPHRGFEMPSDFSPAALKSALAESLDRLQTDYVDLYMLHSPDLTQMRGNAELWEALDAMRRSGQARTIGLSARSPADARVALDLFAFDAIQVNFNLIDQRAQEVGLLQTAEDRDIAVIARTPLCFGYLTGRLSGAETFSELDHRANWPDGQLKRWAQSPGLFDHLCARRRCTPSQLALLFCLSPGAVATTIPGMMSLAEVEDDIAASDLAALDPNELEEIGAIYQANTFYDPSAKQKAAR